jgi:glycosyl transferase family 92
VGDWEAPPYSRDVKAYFSVCTVFRDNAIDLREWIEFHRLVGAERFFLYNNNSVDNYLEALRPYVDEGTVVLHDWPTTVSLQTGSIQACLSEHRHDSRWIAFLDTDEFLFSPTMRPLTEILPEYEQWPGVGVNQKWFGPSGHRTRPPGLVIENYLGRQTRPITLVKSIVDPSRVERPKNPHAFFYREGTAVDEHKRPFEDWDTQEHSCSILRINHYLTKSAEEHELKHSRGEPDTGRPRRRHQDVEAAYRRLSEVPDDLVTAYLPSLREALARRARADLAQKGAGADR